MPKTIEPTEPTDEPTDETIDETIELYYESHGDPMPGTVPLVLIHGGGSTIETNWAAILPHLTVTRQVLAVELQGHGHTPSTGRPYNFENSAGDVAALLHRLGIERVDVLGFSNGGNVAMRLAMRHPHLVRRQLVASAFYQRDGMIDGFWEGMIAADIASMPEPYLAADRAINPDPAHQQQLFDLDSTQMRDFTDWTDADLTTMTAPTLYINGTHDVVRVEHAVEMARLTPNAQLLVLPTGHGQYLGETLSSGGDLSTMHATLPWLLAFLDDTTHDNADPADPKAESA